MRLFTRCLAPLCFIFVLSACKGASLTSFWKKGEQNGPAIHYTVQGLEADEETRIWMQSVLDDRAAQLNTVENTEQQERLEEYARRYIAQELTRAAHARGYYDAEVKPPPSDAQGVPAFIVKPGKPYTLASIKVEPEQYAPLLKEIPLKARSWLISSDVLEAQADLKRKVGKGQCYYNLSVENEVIIDPLAKTAEILFTVRESPQAHFGPVIFEGNETLTDRYLSRMTPWKEGDCFRREKLDLMRKNLLASTLFSKVEMMVPEELPESSEVTVTVILKERAQRTVKAGATYYTDEGLGLLLGWEHRNFMGGAEKFTADLNLSLLEQSLEVELNKPFFLRRDQSLILNAAMDKQDTEAYSELGMGAGAHVQRKFGKHVNIAVGAEAKITKINEENDKTKTFGLISFPSTATYDDRDDPLDPHKGSLVKAEVKPVIDAFGQGDPFMKFQISATRYTAITDSLVLAGRASAGSLVGADPQAIPATERFFAGGGGSVRGFAYQEVGPTEDNDPIGGRSITELSAELRYRVTDKFGAVAFVDAGQVSEDVSPRLDDLSVGAGLGFRYYTDFGPVRFDVATPLTDAETVDSKIQFYISIGQAF